ncbi:hypothetical protein VB005_00247 [Metarhizium brunneum]
MTIARPIREQQDLRTHASRQAVPQASTENENPTLNEAMETKKQVCVGFADDSVCEREIRACSLKPKTNTWPENLSGLAKCVDRRHTGALDQDANAAAAKTNTPTKEPASTVLSFSNMNMPRLSAPQGSCFRALLETGRIPPEALPATTVLPSTIPPSIYPYQCQNLSGHRITGNKYEKLASHLNSFRWFE